MCRQHPNQEAISDATPIFRYISLHKFIQLMTTGLYVPSADSFEDPNEMSVPWVESEGRKDINPYLENCLDRAKELSESGKPGISQNNLDAMRACLLKEIHEFQTHFGSAGAKSQVNDQDICSLGKILLGQKSETEKREKLLEIFRTLWRESFKTICVSCWNGNPSESLSMWKTYAEKKGVRIETTVGDFWELVNDYNESTKDMGDSAIINRFDRGDFSTAKLFMFVDKVSYLSAERIEKVFAEIEGGKESVERTFFIKNEAYRSEEEIRILLHGPDVIRENRLGLRPPNKGFELKIKCLCRFIKKIVLSPFLREEEKRAFRELCKKMFSCFPEERISDSEIKL